MPLGRLASAQSTPSLYERESSSQPPANKLPELLTEIGLDQKLNAQVPLDLPFKDETGRDVRLGDYFGKRPVILTLVYYECPMLCTQVLNGLTSALGVLKFTRRPGVRHRHGELRSEGDAGAGARRRRRRTSSATSAPGAESGWHFLTGDEQRDRGADARRSASATPTTRASISSRTPAASWC